MNINHKDKGLILTLINDELTNRTFHKCKYMKDLQTLKLKLEEVLK